MGTMLAENFPAGTTQAQAVEALRAPGRRSSPTCSRA